MLLDVVWCGVWMKNKLSILSAALFLGHVFGIIQAMLCRALAALPHKIC
jgi:hypothetical protein